MNLRQLLLTILLTGSLLTAGSAATTTANWYGWITDEHCGAKGANAAHKDCADKCIEKGSKYVLYNNANHKCYQLDRQDIARQNVGHEVVVTGTLEGDMILIKSITAAAPIKT